MTYPIIKTDNYILITSDEEIKEDDYYICWDNCYDPARYSIYVKSTGENGENAKKIIAHLPLNPWPEFAPPENLEGVPLLPPLPMTFPTIECIGDNLWEELTGGQEVSVNRGDWSFGFGIGYNKAKEKYKFTEDDIRKAIAMGYDWCHQKHIPHNWMIDNFIQSLSQPKIPIGFKVAMDTKFAIDGHTIIGWEKIIINGVMQGEWIFE